MTVEEWLGKENQLGIDIWNSKYRYNNETFDEWLRRVSGGNGNVERLIKEKKFLFAGRILAGRGTQNDGRKVTLSNCYVTSTEDSIEDIFETAKKIARTFSYGGGIGVDISTLSPKGARVHNAAKTSTGAVSFMDLFSLTTGMIGQNGRRGALMLSMSCDHPDIEDFISVKNDLNKVTYANISVRASDGFMQAVVDDAEYTLSFTRDETGETIQKTVKARDILHKIAENNWRNGEPGMLFWDNICGHSLLSDVSKFKFSGVNPCGEEPLPSGGSCLLGSINLAEYVTPDGKNFRFNQFEDDVNICVTALNEVLHEGLPLHPLREQRECVDKWRQIGLGIMGLGDMLVKMGIRYGSEEAQKLCNLIGMRMANAAIRKSAMLTTDYGTFSEWDDSVKQSILGSKYFNEACNRETYNIVNQYGLANSQILTTAPTGTLSTMLGISGGIEPIFANSYTRTTKSIHDGDVDYKVYPAVVKSYMDANCISDERELPDYFVTAQDIPYKERIGMQAAFQKYIDASISSTINLPNSATIEDIESIYVLAWKAGLKGITVFRDGCERTAILNTGKSESKHSASECEKRGFVKRITENEAGLVRHLTTGCGTLHCEAYFDTNTGDLIETYFSKGSTGGCLSNLTGLSRMISLAARGGISVEDIVDQLKSSVSCPSYAVRSATKHDTSTGICCPSAIGNALVDMWKEFNSKDRDSLRERIASKEAGSAGNPCPMCGSQMAIEGGCKVCKNCGYSPCG